MGLQNMTFDFAWKQRCTTAADRYWVGSAGGAWADNANWSSSANTCGAGGGASFPVAGA